MFRKLFLLQIFLFWLAMRLSGQEFEQLSSKYCHSFSYDIEHESLIAWHHKYHYSTWQQGSFANSEIGFDVNYCTKLGEEFIYFKNKTLCTKNANSKKEINVSQSFDSVFVATMYQDKIWIGTNNGIWTWDKKELIHEDIGSVYNDQKVKILKIYGNDLWFVVNNAAFNWNDNLHPVILDEHILGFYVPQVKSLKGQFFVQTKSGFFIYDQHTLKRIFIPEIGQLEHVVSLVECNRNIFFADNKLGIVSWDISHYLYKKLNNPSFNPENINDLFVGPYGGLWVATDTGVYRHTIDPTLENQTPSLILKVLKIDGNITDPNHISSIYKGDILNAELDIEHWIKPQRIVTEYRTNDGQNWTSIGNENHVVHKITVQDQYLHLRSSIDQKNYSYSAKFPFYVQDQSWMNYLYAMIGLTIFMFLIGVLALNHNNNKINNLKKDAQSLRLENKALKHEQKALQLQMNPHFLFNALNSIQGLISLGEAKQARHSLKQFSLLMRQTLDHSRSEYITIQEEIHFLERYMQLEQLIREYSFDYVINLDKRILTEYQIEPMMIQAFLENAIIHGVGPLTDRKGCIDIDFSMDEKQEFVLVRIKDNGVGLQEKQHSVDGHRSTAILVTKERLSKYKGAYIKMESSSSSPQMEGTMVSIKMPIFTY